MDLSNASIIPTDHRGLLAAACPKPLPCRSDPPSPEIASAFDELGKMCLDRQGDLRFPEIHKWTDDLLLLLDPAGKKPVRRFKRIYDIAQSLPTILALSAELSLDEERLKGALETLSALLLKHRFIYTTRHDPDFNRLACRWNELLTALEILSKRDTISDDVKRKVLRSLALLTPGMFQKRCAINPPITKSLCKENWRALLPKLRRIGSPVLHARPERSPARLLPSLPALLNRPR